MPEDEPVDDPLPRAAPDAARPSPRRSAGSAALVVTAIGCLVLIPILGVMAALAIYGVRKYLVNAKSAEGRAAVMALGRGMAECANRTGALPPSATPVPPKLGAISGRKYMSAPAEWSDTAYSCAGFSMSAPQYFQYRWVLTSADAGYASGVADLDGDGTPDVSFSLAVSCSAGQCRTAPALDEQTQAAAPPSR